MFVSTRNAAKALLVDLVAVELPTLWFAWPQPSSRLESGHLLRPGVRIKGFNHGNLPEQSNALADEIRLSNAQLVGSSPQELFLTGLDVHLFAHHRRHVGQCTSFIHRACWRR